jgi:hypothetical protein
VRFGLRGQKGAFVAGRKAPAPALLAAASPAAASAPARSLSPRSLLLPFFALLLRSRETIDAAHTCVYSFPSSLSLQLVLWQRRTPPQAQAPSPGRGRRRGSCSLAVGAACDHRGVGAKKESPRARPSFLRNQRRTQNKRQTFLKTSAPLWQAPNARATESPRDAATHSPFPLPPPPTHERERTTPSPNAPSWATNAGPAARASGACVRNLIPRRPRPSTGAP